MATRSPLTKADRVMLLQGVDEESNEVTFVEHMDFGTADEPSMRGTAMLTVTKAAWKKAGSPDEVPVPSL